MVGQEGVRFRPWVAPPGGWWATLKDAWAETGKDNVGLIAAGVAFYGFLALVPVIASTVLIYGLAANAETVIGNVTSLTSVLPTDAAKLVGEQLMSAVKTSGDKKGVGLLVAIALALFSARSGAGAVVTALNVAYEEQEKRGFVRLTLLALGVTVTAVMMAVLAAVAIASMAKLEALLPDANIVVLAIGRVASYLFLAIVGAGAAAALYWIGPSRDDARFTWLSPGSFLASFAWIVLTLGFGFYVRSFGNYNATYGSLGAIVVMLTWLYLSSYVLLFGAELNAALERRSKPPAAAPAASVSTVSTVSTAPANKGAARLIQVAGAGKAGVASTALATLGLARLRREGKATQGAALLAAAGALAWWRRRK